MTTAPRRRRTIVATYTPDAIARAFEPWLTQQEPSDAGEMRMFCPLCEDRATSRTPSASINPSKGEWNCLKSDDHGGKISALAREVGVTVRRSSAAKRPAAPQKRQPLENQDAPYDWAAALASGQSAAAQRLRRVLADKGISPETASASHVGMSGDSLTYPVRESGGGRWLQVKHIQYGRNGSKRVNQTPGAVAMLYLGERLDALPALPVLLCEGETDTLLAGQESAGLFVAVGVTGGAGSPPRDLSTLAKREVFVAYDCDDAGRKGAAKIAARLAAAGARVHVLDLSRFGLPVTETHGADLSDYFRKYGGTAERLADEFDRVRSVDPAEEDDVLAAMQAAFLELGEPRTDYTAALMTEDDILAAAPPDYIVEPFVPRGMFSAGFGQPGSFKTYVGGDLSNCVRAGIDWHGHAVAQGAVLLLEAEGVQQLQARIIAWKEHHGNPDMAAFRALDEPLDLSTPEGAAALVRTVRGMEAATGERVALVWVDPAALYMSGSENEDGNRNLALGLNAVAKYLQIGVLLIVHTNATGERARGTDHFRMLAGSYFKVERLGDGTVGVVQEKVKNTSPRALTLRTVEYGSAVAFDTEERMSALEYLARKDRSTWTSKTTHRLSEARAARETKDDAARELLLAEVQKDPGVVQGKLLARCKGNHIGHELLLANLDRLVTDGAVRVEIVGTGKNAPKRHYLADGEGA